LIGLSGNFGLTGLTLQPDWPESPSCQSLYTIGCWSAFSTNVVLVLFLSDFCICRSYNKKPSLLTGLCLWVSTCVLVYSVLTWRPEPKLNVRIQDISYHIFDISSTKSIGATLTFSKLRNFALV